MCQSQRFQGLCYAYSNTYSAGQSEPAGFSPAERLPPGALRHPTQTRGRPALPSRRDGRTPRLAPRSRRAVRVCRRRRGGRAPSRHLGRGWAPARDASLERGARRSSTRRETRVREGELSRAPRGMTSDAGAGGRPARAHPPPPGVAREPPPPPARFGSVGRTPRTQADGTGVSDGAARMEETHETDNVKTGVERARRPTGNRPPRAHVVSSRCAPATRPAFPSRHRLSLRRARVETASAARAARVEPSRFPDCRLLFLDALERANANAPGRLALAETRAVVSRRVSPVGSRAMRARFAAAPRRHGPSARARFRERTLDLAPSGSGG